MLTRSLTWKSWTLADCNVSHWHPITLKSTKSFPFSADEQYEREEHHELIAVFHNGTLKWIPSAIYKSSCRVDMTNFPFDEQTCSFKFGSWTYDGLKLELNFLIDEDIHMGEYVGSAEWDILSTHGFRRERKYPCCGDDPYPELIYTVKIKRLTAFYVVVLVLPCLLLSCLTLVMFWFPPQRPDRTGLGKFFKKNSKQLNNSKVTRKCYKESVLFWYLCT